MIPNIADPVPARGTDSRTYEGFRARRIGAPKHRLARPMGVPATIRGETHGPARLAGRRTDPLDRQGDARAPFPRGHAARHRRPHFVGALPFVAPVRPERARPSPARFQVRESDPRLKICWETAIARSSAWVSAVASL